MKVNYLKPKSRLDELNGDKVKLLEAISRYRMNIDLKLNKIDENNKLMEEFKNQERRDYVMNLYKKCVHRDGIPKILLTEHIVPTINSTLDRILSIAPFKVWLDEDTFKPKLSYYNRPDAIIDCISASGKERTFSSVVLKFALNQINSKSKPSLFLLDEVMGKLDENSVDEFIEILKMVKVMLKRLLIIEHKINLEPDYMISVNMDDNGISYLSIE